ncbi:MAG: pyridoxal-phosphate dependent enzyme [Telmatospirillum sp.]|nr:pyridoxal-phosphate dependent enzyme [Telmatospirillum sp.]
MTGATGDKTLGDRAMLERIEAAAEFVRQVIPPTPHYRWPLIEDRAGCEVWIKHDNHGPAAAGTAARGAVVYLSRLMAARPGLEAVVTAGVGNHGRAIAWAARLGGLKAVMVVPEDGPDDPWPSWVEVIEAGEDVHEAFAEACRIGIERDLPVVPTFHPWLVQGAAGATLELLRAEPALDTLYVPVGTAVAIASAIAVRDALGAATRIVGVVPEGAPAFADSFWAGRVMTTPTARSVARGLVCRIPDRTAVDIIVGGADRLVTVSDAAILEAISLCLSGAKTVADGAGAAPLAALLTEGPEKAGGPVGLLVTGGNLDRALAAEAVQAPLGANSAGGPS